MRTISLCLAVLLSPLAASAAQINFDALHGEQGFNFRRDVQDSFGVITSLKIGATVFKADITGTKIVNGADQKASVVGVLSSAKWNSGMTDPIALKGLVTTANKQVIQQMLHSALTDTKVEIEVEVYQYDPLAKVWFTALAPNMNAALKGLIAKEGKDKLLLSLGKEPNAAVKSPQNWELDLTVMPQPLTQSLTYCPSPKVCMGKQWGVAVAH
jgi:hypothetical protein